MKNSTVNVNAQGNLLKGSRFRVNTDKLETWVVTFCYIAFTVLLLKEVIFRYCFAASSDYIEEISRYLFVFLVYFAAAEAIKTRSHLSINIIEQYVSERAKLYLYFLYDICFLALGIIVIEYSIQIIQMQLSMNILAVSETLQKLGLQMAYVYAALPLGWGLIIYRIIQRFIKTVNEIKQLKG